MRRVLTPHARAEPGAAAVLHFRCDEVGAGNDLTDEQSIDLIEVGSAGATGSLFATPAGTTGARTTSAGNYFTEVATAEIEAAGLSDWTFTGIIKPDAISGTQVFFYVGGSAASSAATENILIELAVTSTGALRFAWEHSSGTRVDGTGTGASGAGAFSGAFSSAFDIGGAAAGGMQAGGTYFVVARRKTNGSSTEVTLWVYDLDNPGAAVRDEFTGLTGASGGTSSDIFVGRGEGGDEFTGALDELILWDNALTDDAVDQLARQYMSDLDEQTLVDSGFYSVAVQVHLEDGDGGFIDVTDLYGWDMLESAQFGEGDVDDDISTATVRIYKRVYDLAASPFMSESLINVGTMGADAMVRLTQRAMVKTALLADGADRDDPRLVWRNAFEGVVTDFDVTGDVVVLELADDQSILQDTWIEPVGTSDEQYGSSGGTAVQGEMQQIVDDNEPSGGYRGRDSPPEIYVPSSPGWNVFPFRTPPTLSVGTQLQDLVSQIGWNLRTRWDAERLKWRLTFFEPPRSATWSSGDLELHPRDILEAPRSIKVGRADIRNVCEVEYGPQVTTDNTGTIERATVSASDAASITKYGRRYCRIGLDSTRNVNDVTTAQAIADNVVSDLAEPKAVLEVDVFYRPHVELHDMVRVYADGIHFDTDEDFAVVGVSHSTGASERKTTLTLRAAAPAGRVMRWWDKIIEEGRLAGSGLSPPETPAGIALIETVGGVVVSWDWPANQLNRAYLETEIHVSTTASFTPSSSTLRSITRGQNAALLDLGHEDQHVKVLHRDRMGNVTIASAEVTGFPRWTTLHPRFRAERSSTQAYTASSPAKVQFNSEDFDIGNNFDPTTNHRFTAPSAGVYSFESGVRGAITTDNGVARLLLYVNGTMRARGDWYDSSITPSVRILDAQIAAPAVHLNENDYVEIFWEGDKSATLTAHADGSAQTYFTGLLVAQD